MNNNKPIGNGARSTDLEYGAKVAITGFHHQIHLGNAYIASHKFSSIANNAVAEFYVKVPANYEPHVVFHRDLEGNADVALFEDTTTQAPNNDGTGITPRNLNRNKADASQIEWFHTPTVLVDGTQLLIEWNAAGTGGVAGGSEGVFDEFELAKGKNYLFRVTNRSGQARDIGIFSRYYELEDL